MKKLICVATAFLLLALTACGQDTQSKDATGSQPPDITLLDSSVWPENEYTEGLPVPNGTVNWVAFDAAHESCSINIAGMSEPDYNDYMTLLRQKGFSEIENTSELIKGQDYVATGTLLFDGERGLSISYAHHDFTIYISLAL